MINDRRQLADVYQQTIDIVLEGHYTSENGEEVKLPDNTKMLKGSRFYTKPLDASNIPTLAEGSTKIIVKNADSIHCGHQLQQEGYNPVVLNLASRRNPGGGVKNGSRAQEESLFRSTNLFLSMYRYAEYAEDYGLEKSKFQYPMPVRFGGIYVPDAIVFRAGAKDDFALLDTPYYMSFVAVAAINHPDLDRDGNICEEDARTDEKQNEDDAAHRSAERTRQHRTRCIRLRCLPQSSETYRKTVSRSHRREGVQGQVQAHRLRHP